MAVPYQYETRRMQARCWSPADAPALLSAVESSVTHLRRWLPWVARRPTSIEEQVQVLRRFRAAFDLDQDYTFGLFDRSSRDCIGGLGLHPRQGGGVFEIGYWLRVDCTGVGLATEAVSGAVNVAFGLTGARRLEIHCATENRGSARVAERLGFVHEATLSGRLAWENGFDDAMIWTLSRAAHLDGRGMVTAVVASDCLGRVVMSVGDSLGDPVDGVRLTEGVEESFAGGEE